MECPYCKEEIKDGSLKCKHCGSKLTPPDTLQSEEGLYSSYDEVPYYRKQWFFWLMYFTIFPIAFGVAFTGDIYYERNGKVQSFGLVNRAIVGVIGISVVVSFLDLI